MYTLKYHMNQSLPGEHIRLIMFKYECLTYLATRVSQRKIT